MRVDDWLTAEEMGELFHQSPKSIYDWGRRGRIRVMVDYGVRRYNVGDVIEYARDRRRQRWGSKEFV
jgi:predicted site-specific integrase-resolvase